MAKQPKDQRPDKSAEPPPEPPPEQTPDEELVDQAAEVLRTPPREYEAAPAESPRVAHDVLCSNCGRKLARLMLQPGRRSPMADQSPVVCGECRRKIAKHDAKDESSPFHKKNRKRAGDRHALIQSRRRPKVS